MSGGTLLLLGALVAVLVGLDRLAGWVVRPVTQPPDVDVDDLGFEHEVISIRSGDQDLGAWLLRPSQSQPFEPLLLIAPGWGASNATV